MSTQMAPRQPAAKVNPKKFEELVLFVAELSQADENFGATKLNKILFFIDFLSYKRSGVGMTGAKYIKHNYRSKRHWRIKRDR